MLPGAKLLLGLPQPFGRVERPAKAAFDVGAVFLGWRGDVGQRPQASTEPECSTVTRSVFIIWVGMVRVMRQPDGDASTEPLNSSEFSQTHRFR